MCTLNLNINIQTSLEMKKFISLLFLTRKYLIFVVVMENMKKKLKIWKTHLQNFLNSKNNLDVILGKQRCVSNKAGIVYKPEKQQKFHKNLSVSTQKYNSSSITCFYCGRKGHGTSTCYFKKNYNNIKMI